ncbi:hypothetical protein PV11_00206 [Exophiala sideris]|uniref:Ubiquitin-protein ligase E3A N-terminal zinc-binding domain-containing protein n=1 Tax=Exophiala sideris TaxID=1016849 RepID=A0A0D1W6Y1_9EURO|nr:hypothetical protein PV11_00206 [Exophiala sideris]
MALPTDTLKWSAQLDVAPSNRRLIGDKITLPQSALEALLAAAPVVAVQNNKIRNLTSSFDPFNPYSFAAERHAREAFQDRQQQLPHPLTFRIVNPRNGRAVYAGIREFSAEEGTVGLSNGLREALGLQDASSQTSRDGTPSGDVVMTNGTDSLKPETVTIHAKQLEKGTYVKLRPLEAGYDPEDWKSLLERYLRDNFTTLTSGELLVVPGARHEHFRFLVDKFEPDTDGICIVDTDLEVDIEPLNEDQARETLNKRLAKKGRQQESQEGSSLGGSISLETEVQGQVLPGQYVDYELKKWEHTQDLEVVLQASDEDASIDVFVNPYSAHQRSKPREDEYVFGDLSGRATKRLKLSHSNVDLEEAESLNISVHAWQDPEQESTDQDKPVPYTLRISTTTSHLDAADEESPEVSADEVTCKNCRQVVPKRTLPLHEAFCYRNNVSCPKCSGVFLKNSEAWKNHWHCPHDEEHGNTPSSHNKHDSIFHPESPLQCPSCDFQAFDLPILAHHRTTTCPGKEILCQFCHLVVLQQGPDDPSFTDPEVLLSGLTPHELADGARTTECHLCSKIVRLRDMKTHLRLHDRDRVTRPKPRLCANSICGRTIRYEDVEARSQKDQLGLCNECFGPLYVTTYDPEGKMLRRRIERRLLQQLIGGCGKSWCRNAEFCKTGHKNVTGQDRVVSAKDGLPMVKPIMDELAQGVTTGLVFCVDEASQTRRNLANMMASEGEYELEWCAKALEEERGDVGKARDWLKDRAPRIAEVIS